MPPLLMLAPVLQLADKDAIDSSSSSLDGKEPLVVRTKATSSQRGAAEDGNRRIFYSFQIIIAMLLLLLPLMCSD